MVNRTVLTCLIALAAGLAAAPATARDTEGTMAIKGRFCRELGPDQSKHVARICLTSLNIGWRIGSFFGEPVINTAARWQAEEKLHTRDGRVRELSALPAPIANAFREIVPYNVKIAAIAWGEGATGQGRRELRLPADIRAALVFDPGAWSRSGQNRSYNRPGSPKWATMFKQARSSDACAAQANGNLPAEEAKSIVRTGAVLGEPAICEMQFSGLADLDRALAAEAAEIAAKAPKMDSRVSSALDRALGIPSQPAQAPTTTAQYKGKPGSGADALASVMNRKFGDAPTTAKSPGGTGAGAPPPASSGDAFANAFDKVQQKDKVRQKQAKALTGTVTQQMARVAGKCHCYLSGRNCPPALADRSWLHDDTARYAFNNAISTARNQCSSWTALRVRNMTEANKADVLPAKKVELIRTVTTEGEKALAAIDRVERQASAARVFANAREQERQRAEAERREREAREAEERRIAEAKRKQKEEEEDEHRRQRQRQREREMARSNNSGPNYDPTMKALVDAARGMGGGGGMGGWGPLPGTTSGRSYSPPSRSYSPPSRSYESSSRSSSSRGSSSNSSGSSSSSSYAEVTVYNNTQFSGGSARVGDYTFYPASRSGCFIGSTHKLTVWRQTLRGASANNVASSLSRSLSQEVEKNKRMWGHGGNTFLAESRREAENWLRGQGCTTINK
jgi:hypothetical protein